MARMVIRVSGYRQNHGASQLGETAKWLLQFSCDDQLTTPDTSIPADPTPPPPEPSSTAVAATVATIAAAAAVVVVAAISAIVPSAVIAAVVLVSLPPQPPSLPLPLLVDCCLLFVYRRRCRRRHCHRRSRRCRPCHCNCCSHRCRHHHRRYRQSRGRRRWCGAHGIRTSVGRPPHTEKEGLMAIFDSVLIPKLKNMAKSMA